MHSATVIVRSIAHVTTLPIISLTCNVVGSSIATALVLCSDEVDICEYEMFVIGSPVTIVNWDVCVVD